MSDLDTLVPINRTIILQGETLVIEQFRFTQFSKVAKIVQRVKKNVGDFDVKIDTDEDGNKSLDMDYLKLIAECEEEIVELCILATNKDRNFIDKLEGDEGIALLTLIFEVNMDFFSQRILPQLLLAIQRVSKQTMGGVL
jgi:hypothetical protein